jgi:hypothetical protein
VEVGSNRRLRCEVRELCADRAVVVLVRGLLL